MKPHYPTIFLNQPARHRTSRPVLSILAPTDPIDAAIPPDFTLELTWTPVEAETLTISFRISDANHCFKIEASQEDGLMALYEVNGGVYTSLSLEEQAWLPATTYRIAVRAAGPAIQTRVDEVVRNSYSPAVFNQTATGLSITGFANIARLIVWEE